MIETPTVGRVVHYVARGSADGRFPPVCQAATITEVGAWDYVDLTETGPRAAGALPKEGDERTEVQRFFADSVGLEVHSPTGLFFHSAEAGGVCLDEGHEPDPDRTERPLCDGRAHTLGTWHWPARADGDTARAATRDALRDGPPVSAVGRMIYAQIGPEPSDDDPLVGVMDSPALAARVADAVNATLRERRCPAS